ncbi:MAG: hypothetical protein RLZZ605_595 [Bacteroidota bacterium]|jgi:hypothetical protein
MKITSPIQKRLIKHFLTGTPLSIKNIWLIKCSNCSREIRRNFEIPFGVELNRKTITWKDEYSDGYYFEYSLKNSDYQKINDLVSLFE